MHIDVEAAFAEGGIVARQVDHCASLAFGTVHAETGEGGEG